MFPLTISFLHSFTMVNMIVAFGPSEHSCFIAAGSRTYSRSIPTGMKAALDGKVNEPIAFASIGEHDRWFINGKSLHDSSKNVTHWGVGTLTSLNEKLKDSTTTGVSFGAGDAYCWFYHSGSSYKWKFGNLATNQKAWVDRMKGDHGESFKMYLGARETTVMLFSDGRISWHGCSDKLANTLAAVSRQKLGIRFIALSPTDRDRFFIQFKDDSIAWSTSTEIGDRLRDFARDKNLVRRANATLAILN